MGGRHTAKLLHEHHDLACQHRSSVSWDGNQFPNLVLTQLHAGFCLQQGMHVEHIASGLDLHMT